MKTLKQKLIAGLLLIVMTNIIVVAGVIFNRTGEPISSITLSERELSMPYSWQVTSVRDSENTGLSLNIDFERSQYLKDLRLSKQQLKDLGFNLGNKDVSYWTNSQVFYWALEYDGKHFDADLKEIQIELLEAEKRLDNAEQSDDEKNIRSAQRERDYAQENLERMQQAQSRLYVVAFDQDLDVLRQKFAQQTNIIFMQGLVKPYKHNEIYAKITSQEYLDAAINDKPQTLKYGLRFSSLLISSVHVSLEQSNSLQNLSAKDYDEIYLPRYEVDFIVGRRLEPVLLSITRR